MNPHWTTSFLPWSHHVSPWHPFQTPAPGLGDKPAPLRGSTLPLCSCVCRSNLARDLGDLWSWRVGRKAMEHHGTSKNCINIRDKKRNQWITLQKVVANHLVNYHISLIWILRPWLGMISLTNHDFQWGRSEVVIIYPEIMIIGVRGSKSPKSPGVTAGSTALWNKPAELKIWKACGYKYMEVS